MQGLSYNLVATIVSVVRTTYGGGGSWSSSSYIGGSSGIAIPLDVLTFRREISRTNRARYFIIITMTPFETGTYVQISGKALETFICMSRLF